MSTEEAAERMEQLSSFIDKPTRQDAVLFRDLIEENQCWQVVKGWANDGRTFGDEIALLHSELSEALEAFRDNGFDIMYSGDDDSPKPRKPEGVASELADVFIRLLDTCGRHRIDLWAAYREKMAYNKTRAFRHGGKAL